MIINWGSALLQNRDIWVDIINSRSLRIKTWWTEEFTIVEIRDLFLPFLLDIFQIYKKNEIRFLEI